MGNRHLHGFSLGVWLLYCYHEFLFDWFELHSTRSNIFISKLNITAHEHFSKEKKVIKEKERLSQ